MDDVSLLSRLLNGDSGQVLAAALALVIVGGIREWYVWGTSHRRMVAERDEYKAIVFRALRVTKEAIDVVQQ